MKSCLLTFLLIVSIGLSSSNAQSAAIKGDFETFTDLTPIYNEIFETNYADSTHLAPEGYLSITRFSLLVFEYVIFGTLPTGPELDALFEGASGIKRVEGGANGSASATALVPDEFFNGADLFGAFAYPDALPSTFSGYYKYEGDQNIGDTLLALSLFSPNTFLPQDITDLSGATAYSLDTLYPNSSLDYQFFESPIISNAGMMGTDTVTIFFLALFDSTNVANGTINRFILDDIGFDQSMTPTCEQEGGVISFSDGSDMQTICIDGTADPLDVTLVGDMSDNSAWVITDPNGEILALPSSPPFDLDPAGPGTCLIWHLAFEEGLTGAEVGNNASDLDGCFDLSNALTVVRNEPNGGVLAFSDGTETQTICVDGTPDPLDVVTTDASGSNFAWVITDTNGEILALPPAPPFDLDGAGGGTCLIWHLAFEEGLTGAEVGNNASDLDGCFDLSNALTVVRNEPNGGVLAFSDGTETQTICVDGTPDPLDVVTTDASGSNFAWVITDTNGEILALPPAPPFDLDGAGGGTCLIWYLAFEEGLTGAEVGNNASDLDGCFDLSNALTVVRNEPNGGVLAFSDGTETQTICVDGTPDPLDVVTTDASGSNFAWVITDTNGEILALPSAPPFDLDGAGGGTCLIWYLAFEEGLTGAEVGNNASDLDGCFDLSNALTVVRNEPNGGVLAFSDGTEAQTICAGDGTPDPLDISLNDAFGSSSAWVITDTNGEILGLPAAPPFDLDDAGVGTCLIWNLSFDGMLSGAEVGMNANDLEGCFSLSNAITVERVDSGAPCVVSTSDLPIGIKALEVFPNPVDQLLHAKIDGEGVDIINVYVSSINGQDFYLPSEINDERLSVHVSSLNPGIYVLNIQTNKGFIHSTFIK